MSLFNFTLFFVACLMALVCAEDSSNINPCFDDITNICGLPFPESYQGIYDSRMCLQENKLKISNSCLNYVTNVSPSIVEPCYQDIKNYCKNVQPGDNRMSLCLSKYPSKISSQCMTAILRSDSETNTASKSEGNDIQEVVTTKYKMIEQLQSFMTRVSKIELTLTTMLFLQDAIAKIDVVEESLEDILNHLTGSSGFDSVDGTAEESEVETEEGAEEYLNDYQVILIDDDADQKVF